MAARNSGPEKKPGTGSAAALSPLDPDTDRDAAWFITHAREGSDIRMMAIGEV